MQLICIAADVAVIVDVSESYPSASYVTSRGSEHTFRLYMPGEGLVTDMISWESKVTPCMGCPHVDDMDTSEVVVPSQAVPSRYTVKILKFRTPENLL